MHFTSPVILDFPPPHVFFPPHALYFLPHAFYFPLSTICIFYLSPLTFYFLLRYLCLLFSSVILYLSRFLKKKKFSLMFFLPSALSAPFIFSPSPRRKKTIGSRRKRKSAASAKGQHKMHEGEKKMRRGK